jgi:hypothetical protein
MEQSLSLINIVKKLHGGEYKTNDIESIYFSLISVDDELLNVYLNQQTLMSHDNDLELFIESVAQLMDVCERMEEYEKCHGLKLIQEKALRLYNHK